MNLEVGEEPCFQSGASVSCRGFTTGSEFNQIDEPLCAITDNRVHSGRVESTACIVPLASVPKHIHVEVGWLTIRSCAEVVAERCPMLTGDLEGYVNIVVVARIAVAFPDGWHELKTADLAGTADRSVVVSRFKHSQSILPWAIEQRSRIRDGDRLHRGLPHDQSVSFGLDAGRQDEKSRRGFRSDQCGCNVVVQLEGNR